MLYLPKSSEVEMNRCKHSGGSKCVKNGFANEKQRYKYKDCGKSYRDGDLMEKTL